jgi:hypothetical protein
MMRSIGSKMAQKPVSLIGMKMSHQPKYVMGALKVMNLAISPSDFNKGDPEGINDIYGNTSNSSDVVYQPIGLKSYAGSAKKSKLEKSRRK